MSNTNTSYAKIFICAHVFHLIFIQKHCMHSLELVFSSHARYCYMLINIQKNIKLRYFWPSPPPLHTEVHLWNNIPFSLKITCKFTETRLFLLKGGKERYHLNKIKSVFISLKTMFSLSYSTTGRLFIKAVTPGISWDATSFWVFSTSV